MSTPSLRSTAPDHAPSRRRAAQSATSIKPINHGTPWSRSHLASAYVLYKGLCDSPGQPSADRKGAIQGLANDLGREAGSISIRLQNYTAVRQEINDMNPGANLPTLALHGYPAAPNVGPGVATMMIEIMISMGDVPSNIIVPPRFQPCGDARRTIVVISEEDLRQLIQAMEDDIRAIENDPTRDATTKQQLIMARRGQGLFRDLALRLHPGCAVYGPGVESYMLIAGHILPWRHATDRQRLNPHNCLLLSQDLARFFDLDLIGFDPETREMVPSRRLAGGLDHLLLRNVPHHLHSDYVVHPEQAVHLKAQLLRVKA